jgi:hypothetical protein
MPLQNRLSPRLPENAAPMVHHAVARAAWLEIETL